MVNWLCCSNLGGGHSCFKDDIEARIGLKMKKFCEKEVDIEETISPKPKGTKDFKTKEANPIFKFKSFTFDDTSHEIRFFTSFFLRKDCSNFELQICF